MRIRLDITYDGTDFFGWQTQSGKRTVAGVIEEHIKSVLGVAVTLKGAARTDRGVHALSQVAHFDIESTHIPPQNIAAAFNMVLAPDIKITASAEEDSDFHARLSAKGKTYLYKIFVSEIKHPLYQRTHYIVPPPFDSHKAEECLSYITGTHNFTSFCYADKEGEESKVRTISAAKITENGNEIDIEITGDGFLHNMVRIIAGTVVKITKNKKFRPEEMKTIIAACDRQKAASTAPACGLYLKEIFY